MRKPSPPPAEPSAELDRLRARVAGLEAEREQLRQFADQAASMLYLYDLDDERIVYANRRHEELLGYACGELTAPGFDFRVLVAPDSLERVRRSHELHLRGEEHLPFEFTLLAKDGRAVDVMLATWLVQYGGHRCVAGLAADISAQHRAAEQLRLAKEELERQNVQLRALDRIKDGLVRDLSHELKTPVAKQAMQLELLRGQLGEACTGPVERTLEAMAASVGRQQRMIRDLLDLASLESGRRVYRLGPVRLDEALLRVLEDHRPMLEAARVAVTVRVEPVVVTADGEMLEHVLSNLVNNGVKFASGAGARRLKLAAAREGGLGVARVADNGVGLSTEELDQAFERFYKASPSVEGSGVGLSICRSIMEGMGGTVTLASPGRGGGAVAAVTLPLA